MLSTEQVRNILSNIDIEMPEDDEVEVDGVMYSLLEREDMGWKSDGKYETNYCIYELMSDDGDKSVSTGIFVGQGKTRIGSYYSEYYYEYENFDIVEQIEVVVKKWVVVKKD